MRSPQAFLMDEPLSNLDAKLRVEMRSEIARIQRLLSVATVYVTHDQVEAMTMGDRVAVLRDGQLQQVATPQDIYDRPANEFVAGFMGSPPMNLVPCQLRPGRSRVEVVVADQSLELPLGYADTHSLPEAGADVVLGVRPEDVLIADETGANVLKVRVERVEALGSEALVHLAWGEGGASSSRDARPRSFIAKVGPRVTFAPGDVVSVQVSPEHIHFFDAGTGISLRAGGR